MKTKTENYNGKIFSHLIYIWTERLKNNKSAEGCEMLQV